MARTAFMGFSGAVSSTYYSSTAGSSPPLAGSSTVVSIYAPTKIPRAPIARQQPRQPSMEIAMTLRPLSAWPAYIEALIAELAVGILSFGMKSGMRLKMSGSLAAVKVPIITLISAKTASELTLPAVMVVKLQAIMAMPRSRTRFILSAALPNQRPANALVKHSPGPASNP